MAIAAVVAVDVTAMPAVGPLPIGSAFMLRVTPAEADLMVAPSVAVARFVVALAPVVVIATALAAKGTMR